MSNQLWKIWIPAIVFVVGVVCMGVLHFAWEGKYTALGEELQAMSGERDRAEDLRDAAQAELARLTTARAEDTRRVQAMVRQIEALQKTNAEIVAKSNENVRIAEQNRMTYQAALAERDKALDEANKTIQSLLSGAAVSRSTREDKPIAKEFAGGEDNGKVEEDADKIDTKIIWGAYNNVIKSWESIHSYWGNFTSPQPASEKNKLIDRYNACIEKIVKLQNYTKGIVNQDIIDALQGIRVKIRSAKFPGWMNVISSYKKKAPNLLTPQDDVEKQFDALLFELQEQKKVIEGLPLKKQQAKVLKVRARKTYRY